MKKIILTLGIIGLVWVAGIPQDYGNTEIISIKKNPENIKKLQGMNLDLLMEKDGKIFIVARIDDLTQLQAENVTFAIETPYFPPFAPKSISIQGGINGDFHSYREVEQALLTLEESHASIVEVYDIGDTLEGRNIYAVKISDNVQQDEDEAELIFLGCHHAREWISVEVPLLMAQYLAENYSSNSEISALVNASEIWIIPLVNPDGLEYSIYFYRYWRKNRRDNGNGSFGVDLNRNYSYKWGHDDLGSSPDSNSNVYRGPSAFSEPESQAVRDLVGERDFLALVSYHNYSQVILYPWGHTSEPSHKDILLEYLASNMAVQMEQVDGRVYGFEHSGASFYLTNGDTTDWALGVYDIPAFTIELPPIDFMYGGFFNAEADIQSIFEENLEAAFYLIEWAIQQHIVSDSVASQQSGRRTEPTEGISFKPRNR